MGTYLPLSSMTRILFVVAFERAETIVAEVQEAVSHWPNYAEAAGVPRTIQRQIERTLRLEGF